MMELVSQAEREGVTLAAMVSREISSEEMELIQEDLASRLSENYAKIENFMSEVNIPSMEEILSRRDDLPTEIDLGLIDALSDENRPEDNSD